MPGFLDDLLNAEATLPDIYGQNPVIPSVGLDPVDPFFPPEIYSGGGIWQPAQLEESSFWDTAKSWFERGWDIYQDVAGSQNPPAQPSGGLSLPPTVAGMPTGSLLLVGGAVIAVYLLTKRR